MCVCVEILRFRMFWIIGGSARGSWRSSPLLVFAGSLFFLLDMWFKGPLVRHDLCLN